MEYIYESCAGLDVHQDNVVACVLYGPLTSTRPKKEVRKFDTTTYGLKILKEWLLGFKCEAVAMESTGIYWKPVWHVLQDDFHLILANPRKIKHIPGHKTDKKDAEWIAKLTRIDLIPQSFVPDETIQDLRDLTRTRKNLVESRNRVKNQIHKILQTAGIKLTTYVEDIFGLSGRNLLELLINGEAVTEDKVSVLVYTSLKKKVPQIVDAMNGFLRSHHRFLLDQAYHLMLAYEKTIKEIEDRVDWVLNAYQVETEILIELPGIDKKAASVIIAEIGTDISQFPSAENLASWAGLCPGNNESAGKRKSTHINKGNPFLKRVLCQAAFAASRKKDSKYKAKFYRIKQNRGTQKAIIAIAHDLLRTIYLLFSRNEHYIESGTDYIKKRSVIEAS
nr:IS110 family transposase [uncultured Trichococcus sp.]